MLRWIRCNCSVVDSKPSASSGMKIMGDKGGYASKEDATKALKGLPKGKVQGHSWIAELAPAYE